MLSEFAFAQKTRAEFQVLKLRSEKLLRWSEQLRLTYVRLELRLHGANVRQARVRQGKYFADMLPLHAGTRPFWYMLRDRGSDDILDQRNFETYEKSLEGALKALAKFTVAGQ